MKYEVKLFIWLRGFCRCICKYFGGKVGICREVCESGGMERVSEDL